MSKGGINMTWREADITLRALEIAMANNESLNRPQLLAMQQLARRIAFHPDRPEIKWNAILPADVTDRHYPDAD